MESIYILSIRNNSVRNVDIAEFLSFSKASVSIALKKLQEDEMIEFGEQNRVILTESGEAIAKDIYNKHVLLREFFIRIGVPEEQAIQDACMMEHFLSPSTQEKLKEHLILWKNNQL